MKFIAEPIGYFFSSQHEKYSVPCQANQIANEGTIILNPHCLYEQALEDLNGFDRIWILFWFHKNSNWKTKILPPRGNVKRGVFATRSPHRPNFIGMSPVDLVSVNGLKLTIKNHDLINGTPILDIKPYINYIDSIPAKKQGWLGELENVKKYFIEWSERAKKQKDYLNEIWNLDLENLAEARLVMNPFPYPNNRIIKKGDFYEIALKSWRMIYRVHSNSVEILEIQSGYVDALPQDHSDFPIHTEFKKIFQNNAI